MNDQPGTIGFDRSSIGHARTTKHSKEIKHCGAHSTRAAMTGGYWMSITPLNALAWQDNVAVVIPVILDRTLYHFIGDAKFGTNR